MNAGVSRSGPAAEPPDELSMPGHSVLLGPIYVVMWKKGCQHQHQWTSGKRGGEGSPVSKGLELKKADLHLGIRDSVGTELKL